MKVSGFFRQKQDRVFFVIFRFIDDLFNFNNDELENNYNDICPHKLKLKKKNEDPCKALFSNLSVEVHDTTKLLDNKGDTCPFQINRMPFWQLYTF